MPWYVYALAASVLFAFIPLQRKSKEHNQKDITFWSSLFAFLLTLVLIPFLEFPKFEWFYLGAVFTGFAGVFGGILQFKMSEKNMGRTMSMQLPVQIIACVIFYAFLQPSYYELLTHNYLTTGLTSLAVILLMVASQFLRKSDLKISGFVTIVPVSVLFAVIIVYYKMMMSVVEGNPSHIILAYIMVHYFTVTVCFLVENIFSESRVINVNEKLVSSSLVIAVFYVFAYYFLFLAINESHSPALVLVFNLLIPVWIRLYNLIFKKQDDASLKIALIMLMLTSIMLVIV